MPVDKYANVLLLNELGEEEFEALQPLLIPRTIKKNETVIQAESETTSMMFVLQGKLRVSLSGRDGKEFVISHLEEGQFVGEIALLTDEHRSADVTALEDSSLLVLSRDDFARHTDQYTGLSRLLMRELAMRLRTATLKLGELALLDVYRRVASTLRGIATEQLDGEKRCYVVSERPTHQELSAMVGTSREMVTRALKGLEEDGHISIKGKTIELYSLPL